MTSAEALEIARTLADQGDVPQAAGMLYRLANGGGLDYPGHMRWHETWGACQRASSPEEVRRLFAVPFNAHVQGGTMVIAAEPGFVAFLRAACESCEPDGDELLLEDLTGERPWRIRLQGWR